MNHITTTLAGMLLCAAAYSQSICDSIIVHAVTYDPTHSDSLVQVLIQNTSTTEFFSYPTLKLVDGQDDTIAYEPTVNFFGLGNYKQMHALRYDGTITDPSITDAKLLLYSGFNDTLVCVFEDDYELCVDTCVDMVIIMQGTVFPSAYHRYAYEITDTAGTVMYSDTLSIDSANYTDWDTICLPKGHYTMTAMEEFSEANEDVHLRIDPFYNVLGTVVTGQGANLGFDFSVFGVCVETVPTGLADAFANEIEVIQNGYEVQVSGLGDGSHALVLYNLQGQQVMQTVSWDSNPRLNLRHLTPGWYILSVESDEVWHREKVFVGF